MNRQNMLHRDLIEDGSIYVTKKKIYKTIKNIIINEGFDEIIII